MWWMAVFVFRLFHFIFSCESHKMYFPAYRIKRRMWQCIYQYSLMFCACHRDLIFCIFYLGSLSQVNNCWQFVYGKTMPPPTHIHKFLSFLWEKMLREIIKNVLFEWMLTLSLLKSLLERYMVVMHRIHFQTFYNTCASVLLLFSLFSLPSRPSSCKGVTLM